MAVTSLWSVKGWLGRVVIYMENPDKTENPAHYKKQGMTANQAQGLSDVISYAAQDQKTGLANENAESKSHFVTGIHCQPDTARDEMIIVKKGYEKEGGVVAYHGYQSFAPGEATPEMAHEIGVKLAERLWGGKYQVLVATHLDKESHLHSHFVINTVSYIDGKKFHRTEKDYYNMQMASDALCREYGLSVIENPKRGKSKHYSEWQAERDGEPTWRGMVKSDVDTAIRQSMTERQFFDNLSKMGYEIKPGKDISLRPQGKERFIRLQRNFGGGYAIEGIRRRILAQARPERRLETPAKPHRKTRLKSGAHRARKITGLRALYYHYLYRMGALPGKREPNPKQAYFLFREDIRHMRNIALEIRLLSAHKINDTKQLASHMERTAIQIEDLSDTRKLMKDPAEKSALTKRIAVLRREVKLCGNIKSRSADMSDKLSRAREAEQKDKAKEMNKDEPFRRRR